jgi:hypothetical protein
MIAAVVVLGLSIFLMVLGFGVWALLIGYGPAVRRGLRRLLGSVT